MDRLLLFCSVIKYYCAVKSVAYDCIQSICLCFKAFIIRHRFICALADNSDCTAVGILVVVSKRNGGILFAFITIQYFLCKRFLVVLNTFDIKQGVNAFTYYIAVYNGIIILAAVDGNRILIHGIHLLIVTRISHAFRCSESRCLGHFVSREIHTSCKISSASAILLKL